MSTDTSESYADAAVRRLISRRLEALDTGVVSDAMDSLGLDGALPGIAPMWRCGRVAGPVRTMRLRQLEPGEAPPPALVHLGCRAIERSRPGDVILVAHQGRLDSGGWGGLLSAAAYVRGVRAVVVDGACRDVEEAEQLGMAVFARGGTPVSARGRTVEVAVDEPVEIGHVQARPGDYLIADRTGVLVIDQARVTDVLERAHEMSAEEQRMRAVITTGVDVSEVMGRRYEEMTGQTPESRDNEESSSGVT